MFYFSKSFFQISFLLFLITIILLQCAGALSFNVQHINPIVSGIFHFSGLFISSLLPIVPDEVELKDSKPLGRLTKAEREVFSLPADLKAILTGLIIGDLSILKGKNSINAALRFEQGMIHKDYLQHLYELFAPYCLAGPKTLVRLPSKQTGKVHSSVRFNTRSLPCFNVFYNLFYLHGVKIIPSNLMDLLTPLGLAYLLCDDGCFDKTNRAVIICTECFSKVEVELLASVLTNKFDLKCSVIKKRNGFRVRISAKSLLVLQSLLKDIMPPMMLHKIGL